MDFALSLKVYKKKFFKTTHLNAKFCPEITLKVVFTRPISLKLVGLQKQQKN